MAISIQENARRSLLIYLKGSHTSFTIDLQSVDGENAGLGTECRAGFPIDMTSDQTVEEIVQGIDRQAISAWCGKNKWACRFAGNRLSFNHLKNSA